MKAEKMMLSAGLFILRLAILILFQTRLRKLNREGM